MKTPDRSHTQDRAVPWLFRLILAFLALTGFAQMPIFKRYYIADIPGLGWLDQFFVTHFLHYAGAVLLLGLAAWAAADYLLTGKRDRRLTPWGSFLGLALSGIVLTGVLMVIRNFPGPHFSPGAVIGMDLIHLGLVVLYLLGGLATLLLGKGWTTESSSPNVTGGDS